MKLHKVIALALVAGLHRYFNTHSSQENVGVRAILAIHAVEGAGIKAIGKSKSKKRDRLFSKVARTVPKLDKELGCCVAYADGGTQILVSDTSMLALDATSTLNVDLATVLDYMTNSEYSKKERAAFIADLEAAIPSVAAARYAKEDNKIAKHQRKLDKKDAKRALKTTDKPEDGLRKGASKTLKKEAKKEAKLLKKSTKETAKEVGKKAVKLAAKATHLGSEKVDPASVVAAKPEVGASARY